MYKAIVLAQDDGGTDVPADNGSSSWSIIIMLGMMFLVFYFLMIRPQRKQQKERQDMLSKLEKNTRVVTIGGIYGVVYSVKDDAVVLKIDERNDTRITVMKSAVHRVVGDEEGASDGADTQSKS
jgi:preprotein translocase subunit YajC